MANGNVVHSIEHNGLAPEDYSLAQEVDYYNALGDTVAETVKKQTYLPGLYYSPFRFDDYAGLFLITPPNPIIIPSERSYQGVAPMKLQPSIETPYPYDYDTNYIGY